jgi:TrmH family RNA methyltransferase
MTMSQLTSRDNSLLKTIRLVSSGSRRAPRNLVVAEGIRVLEEVQRAAGAIEAVIFSEHFGSTGRERILLDAWHSEGIRTYKTSEKLLSSVSSVQAPQGAIALVHIPERSFDTTELAKDALIIFACGIQDPGNLGTLIRTAVAVNASLVCTTKGTVSARNPKAIRSSAGAFFRIPVFEDVDVLDFRRCCNLSSIQVYRTDARAGILYTKVNLKSSCAILLGNEGSGMAEEKFADFPAIRIPMAEGVDSLNVAIAGAVILFEVFKQRRNS